MINLNIKEKLGAVLACFFAILTTALLTRAIVDLSVYPILVASMGASAVILFIIPSSPLAQPWAFAGGQLFSAIIGIACAQFIPEKAIAAPCAVGGAVVIMLTLRCLHPPAAATALAPIMAGDALTSLGYSFVLFPVFVNVSIMLMMALLINRWIMKRDYPTSGLAKRIIKRPEQVDSKSLSSISEDEINFALSESDTFVDVTAAEIQKLISQAEKYRFRQQCPLIKCADIMSTEVATVEYGTDIESAWNVMYKQQLQAMPVIDNVQRVIGIVTWSDFFRFLNLNAFDSVQDKFRAFIRRSPEIYTNKPESIGHIMTKSVSVISEQAHIVELIPLMSSSGYRQVPIVNNEKRLVGMIYQAQLIAALYYRQDSNG